MSPYNVRNNTHDLSPTLLPKYEFQLFTMATTGVKTKWTDERPGDFNLTQRTQVTKECLKQYS